MRRIDVLHLQWPFMGSRMLRDQLRLQGLSANRKRVRRLMRLMGIEAIYRRQNTSRRHPEHAAFPCLPRGLLIDRPNQVWAADITYIPMARGFVYLFAVMDWHSRKVLAWRISMDGKGCWRDNVFVERLWRSVKYEEVYLHAYQSAAEARSGIGRYFAFYNARRSHTTLDRQTPDHIHFKSLEPLPLAKAA